MDIPNSSSITVYDSHGQALTPPLTTFDHDLWRRLNPKRVYLTGDIHAPQRLWSENGFWFLQQLSLNSSHWLGKSASQALSRLRSAALYEQIAGAEPGHPWHTLHGPGCNPSESLIRELKELNLLGLENQGQLLLHSPQYALYLHSQAHQFDSIPYACYLLYLFSQPSSMDLPEDLQHSVMVQVDFLGSEEPQAQQQAVTLMHSLWRNGDEVSAVAPTRFIVSFCDAPEASLIALRLGKLEQVMRNKGWKSFQVRHQIISGPEQT